MISVIIPVYNIKNYLKRCVESVLAQSYTDWELLLIDDGSTDGSGELCDLLSGTDGRIKAFHYENGGVSAARNHGIDNSCGEYLTFIDGDDHILSDCLELLSNAAYRYSADLVCYDFIRSDESIVHGSQNVCVLTVEECSAMRCANGYINNSCCVKLYRRSFLQENKIIFIPGLTMAEDTLFSIDCFNASPSAVSVDYYGYIYESGRDGHACARYYPGIVEESRKTCNELSRRLGHSINDDVIYHHIYNSLAEVVNLCLGNPDNPNNLFKRGRELASIALSEPYCTALKQARIFFFRDRVLLFLLNRKMYKSYLILKGLKRAL